VIVVGLATVLVVGCGSTDSTRLAVNVDATHASFPAGWHARVNEYRFFDGHDTAQPERIVSAAHDSAVFDLRGQGRYHIGVIIEPADRSTGTGCVEHFFARSGLYLATIHLGDESEGCRISVLHWPADAPKG
jgi:hypothetical protein